MTHAAARLDLDAIHKRLMSLQYDIRGENVELYVLNEQVAELTSILRMLVKELGRKNP